MRKYYKYTCVFLLFVLVAGYKISAQMPVRYPLIHYPTSLTAADGDFKVTAATLIVLPAHQLFQNEASVLNQLFINIFGKPLKENTTGKVNIIRLKYNENINADEGYRIASSIEVPEAAESPQFGLKYRGYLEVPQDGVYSFYLTCDDGGVLNIANNEVINNDGNHSAIEKAGQVALKKGPHRFAPDFIEAGGGYLLKLKYSVNGGQPQDIPSPWFKHE